MAKTTISPYGTGGTLPVGIPTQDISLDDGAHDFAVSDESGNAIVTFDDGHLRTKNFSSQNVLAEIQNIKNGGGGQSPSGSLIEVNSGDHDFAVSDESGNAIVTFDGGHLRTKNFSSQNVLAEIQNIKNGMGGGSNPIGSKRTIKILFIGNSVSQDHCGYLPWLFTQLYPNEVDFTIADFYYANRTIKDYVVDFTTGNSTGTYSHATNTDKWTNEDGIYLLDALTREDWDFISIQAYTHRGNYEDLSYAPTFVEWLRNNATSSFELCYLMHQSFDVYWTATQQKEVRDAATTIIQQNPVSLLFAPYFCIEQAKQYWTVYGPLSPDGTHLREGLPVMITGMHLMDVICRRLGLKSKIINNGLMMTSAIQSTLSVPGANGLVDDTMNTVANYTKAQYCAIQGTKMADAWYAKAIEGMVQSYN